VKGYTDDHGLFVEQLDLGSSELVSINQLVGLMEEVGDVKLKRSYKIGSGDKATR